MNDLAEMERSLTGLIRWRDLLADELAHFDQLIRDEARLYANAQGLTVKPSINQLRRVLITEKA